MGIDGSFFNGNAGKGSIHTSQRLNKQLERVEADIRRYLHEMEKNDRESQGASNEDPQLREKLVKLQERRKSCQEKLNKLNESGQSQLSRTDADARLLSKRGQAVAGYNVQIAADEKHKLLVACEVVNDGNDMQQLLPMARQAREILESESLTVVADSGYYNPTPLKECQDEKVTPYVPVPKKSSSAARAGLFDRQDFTYDEKLNAFRCPAGELLKKASKQRKGKQVNLKYISNSNSCIKCFLRDKYLPKKTSYRQIYRSEHEEIVEVHRERMRRKGRAYMKKRASLVEHPFGILKIWCGWMHFLMRGFKKVKAEMSLMMLGYNFKRVLGILGLDAFRAYCLLRKSRTIRQATSYFYISFFITAFMAVIGNIFLHRSRLNRRQWKWSPDSLRTQNDHLIFSLRSQA